MAKLRKPEVIIEKVGRKYWRISDAERSIQGTWEAGWTISDCYSEKEARAHARALGAKIVKVDKNPGATRRFGIKNPRRSTRKSSWLPILTIAGIGGLIWWLSKRS